MVVSPFFDLAHRFPARLTSKLPFATKQITGNRISVLRHLLAREEVDAHRVHARERTWQDLSRKLPIGVRVGIGAAVAVRWPSSKRRRCGAVYIKPFPELDFGGYHVEGSRPAGKCSPFIRGDGAAPKERLAGDT